MNLQLSDTQRALLIEVVERALKGGDGVRVKGAKLKTAEVLRRHNLVRGTIELFPQIDGNKLVDSWRCGACGHFEYHCPASGCNHYEIVLEPVGPLGPRGAKRTEYCDCKGFVSKGG